LNVGALGNDVVSFRRTQKPRLSVIQVRRPMPDTENNKEILRYAADVRKFEIELFWKRSTFFWAFSTTALGAYGFAHGHPGLQFAAGCFGLVCAVIWTLVNRGSKYWQLIWERKVEAAQEDAIHVDLFSKRANPIVEQSWKWGAMHFSVSALATALSDFTILLWLGLIVRASALGPHISTGCAEFTLALVTIIYLTLIITWCNRNEENQKRWLWRLLFALFGKPLDRK
jgi:hypothetical protein